ncbi:hypothetical protein [Dasineura jujubifolia toursvirus 2a]|nr:hypothetical protein [Dasineura jujubifolia toursvirus 2a]
MDEYEDLDFNDNYEEEDVSDNNSSDNSESDSEEDDTDNSSCEEEDENVTEDENTDEKDDIENDDNEDDNEDDMNEDVNEDISDEVDTNCVEDFIYEDNCNDSDNETQDTSLNDMVVNKTNKKRKSSKYSYINGYGFPFITKYEKARLLGIRTEQIIAGSKIHIVTQETDPYKIALEELYKKKMPLKIRRYMNGSSKYKDVSPNMLDIID